MKLYKSLLIGTLLAGGFSHQAMAQQMPLEWAYNLPGAGGDSGKDLVTDANGNLILLSEFAATVDFQTGVGTTNLSSAGNVDGGIAKYDPNGNLLWAVKVGGAGNDIATAIDVDNSGNIYVSGYFNAMADFDPGLGTANLTPIGGIDGFILKLDQNGNFLWVKQIGGAGSDDAFGLDVDAFNDIVISGFFAGTVDFDPNVGIANSTSVGGSDAYALKLNSAGNFVWRYIVGSTTDDDARAITSDNSGNVFLTGYFSGMADFDFSGATQNLTGIGEELFVLKISSTGNYVNAISIGSTGADCGRAIHVDSNNDVIVSGYFTGTVDFDASIGTNSKTSGGLKDIFVLKLTNSLGHIWASHASGSSDDEAWSVETDEVNNVFVAGFFRTTVDFDPGIGTQNVTVSCGCGLADQFYWKLNSDGNYLSADFAGAGGNDHSYSFYPSGNNVYITGYLQGTSDYDFDAGVTNLTSAGSGDIYIAKYYNCNPINTNDVIVSCGPITWIDGNTYSSDNNTATQLLTSINGCDSTVHLDLRITDIADQTVNPSTSTLCDDGNVTVDLGSSVVGVFYTLIDQSTSTIVDGPIEGNGSTLTFDAGNVTTTTTYEVVAENNQYNSLTFTGNSSTPAFVNCGDSINDVFKQTNEITVEAWINTNSTNSLQTVAGNYQTNMQFLMRLDDNSGLKAIFTVANTPFFGGWSTLTSTTTIVPGTWYHIAGTWDGTTVKLYVNGVLESSVPFAGTLPAVTNDVRIGGGLTNDTEYFDGDITGVRIWNVTRTQSEINSNKDLCIAGSENGLVAMYNMIDGTGSSVLTDESVNGFDGTLINMDANTSWQYANMPAMTCSICSETMTQTPTVIVNYSNTGTDVQTQCDNYLWIDGNTYTSSTSTAMFTLMNMDGCDSVVTLNLTINMSDATTDVQSNCDSYLWTDGNTYLSSNNTATQTFTNMLGCDSVVTLNLTITTTPIAGATNNGDGTLSATGTGTYQWINCGINAAVSGATSATFVPSVNGNYAIVVTNGLCDDTSACVNYNSVGIYENSGTTISLYPNPTNGMFVIEFGDLNTTINIVITNSLGQIVYAELFESTQITEVNLVQPSGVYFVNVYSEDQLISTLKLIRQ